MSRPLQNNKIQETFFNPNSFFRKKESRQNSPVNPWMSQALVNSRKRKQLIYTRKLCRPTLHNIQQFKDFSNRYKTLCRAAKRNYYSAKIEKYKNESKKTWQTIREVLGNIKDKSKTPEYFIENGNIIQGILFRV